jgi:hypothetical protein
MPRTHCLLIEQCVSDILPRTSRMRAADGVFPLPLQSHIVIKPLRRVALSSPLARRGMFRAYPMPGDLPDGTMLAYISGKDVGPLAP